MRYFDVNQNPVMINQEGMVYRLETDNMLVQESANYQLSEMEIAAYATALPTLRLTPSIVCARVAQYFTVMTRSSIGR